jgi:hypothetical protein
LKFFQLDINYFFISFVKFLEVALSTVFKNPNAMLFDD